jgi:hypothetical protein
MSDRNRKHPNSLKHGAFAVNTCIVPGENSREFEKLFAEQRDEWKPQGPTELDKVLTITKCIWRKRRIQRFLAAKVEGCTYDPKHPLFDEAKSLAQIYFIVKVAPDKFDEALLCVSPAHAEHLREKCSRHLFKSEAKWLKAIAEEIHRVLLPEVERLDYPLSGALLDSSAQVLTPEVLEHEIAMEERNEKIMDAAIKSLIQIQAFKEVRSSTARLAQK